MGLVGLQAGTTHRIVARWDAQGCRLGRGPSCRQVAGWVADLGDHLALCIVDLVRARAEIAEITGAGFVAHQQQVGVAVLDKGEVGQVEPEVGNLVRARVRVGASVKAGAIGLGSGL